YSHGATVTIADSLFQNNSAATSINLGGAIYDSGSQSLTINTSTFDSNSVGGSGTGGALYVTNDQVSITNSTFDNNSTNLNGQGGSLFVGAFSTTTILQTTISEGVATQ